MENINGLTRGLQDALDEVNRVIGLQRMRGAQRGVSAFHARFFFSDSKLSGVALTAVGRRLRRLETLGWLERVPGSRNPILWRPTKW